MEKIRLLKSRKIASFLLSFVITMIIDMCIVLVRHSIINISFVLTFFVLPFIGLFLIFCVIFSEKKIITKTVLFVVTSVVTLAFIFGFFMVGTFEELTRYKNEKVETPYLKIVNDSMPELNELGNPVNIELFKYYSSFAVFHYDTDILICKYDEDEYSLQKEQIGEKYVFQNSDGLKAWAPTTIDGYEFRMLSKDEYDLYYPKNIIYIATNDETKEIVYMNYYDDDRDYIDSLAEFIENDCGWKYIR